ncbi:copper oxidase, partial [Streptomyces sp. SID8455]|nr:copper oxidase [Streptomyces sp. SID8455]
SHSDMGMAGLLLIKKPDGTIPGYEPHHVAGASEPKNTEEKKAEGAAEHRH